MEYILVCEICFEHIGKFDDEKVHLPLRGDMFDPIGEGYPRFCPEPAHMVDWEAMRCPVCRVRPIVYEERVYTDEGYWDVPETPGPRKKKGKRAKS